MCGISGVVNCGDRQHLARMNAIQEHRGPDDLGIWERRFADGQYFGLANRRLAIQDLSSGGHMPMCNDNGSVWITYNGEIYNCGALRAFLSNKGYTFNSRTDTEVVLRLYEEEGCEALKRLSGMFAFAICDLRFGTPTLVLARDHFGIKPLYYHQQGNKLAFASEIKALLQLPHIEVELDYRSLDQFLSFLWVPEPKTIFSGIFKLPAGHCAVFRQGKLHIEQYWDLQFPDVSASFCRSEEDLAGEIRERFRQSVESQMVGDVPVGAFLSAGLDSSAIVAMMAAKRPVRTYTVTFPAKYRVGENALDDPGVAARFARNLGCENEQIVVEPEVTSLLPKLIWHMDEPTADPAIIPAFLVCQEASRSATVLLSGVGGDELFAGYRKYCAYRWGRAYRRVPYRVQNLFSSCLSRLPALRGCSLKGSMRLAKKMSRSASLPPEEAFVMNCTYLDHAQKAAIYTPSIMHEVAGSDSAIQHHAAFERVRHADFLNQMLYVDTKIFMATLNLTYNDKMSMASSVEVRVPFLDRDFVEFVAREVPPALKMKGRLRPLTKHIFRRAMRDLLTKEVLRQPKAGFAAPIDYWLANDLKEPVDDLLSDSQLRKRGLFRPEVVRRFIDEHRSGKQDWSMQIWQFLTFELWMQVFMDRSVSRSNSLPALQVSSA